MENIDAKKDGRICLWCLKKHNKKKKKKKRGYTQWAGQKQKKKMYRWKEGKCGKGRSRGGGETREREREIVVPDACPLHIRAHMKIHLPHKTADRSPSLSSKSEVQNSPVS
jgi:hypothetical protein